MILKYWLTVMWPFFAVRRTHAASEVDRRIRTLSGNWIGRFFMFHSVHRDRSAVNTFDVNFCAFHAVVQFPRPDFDYLPIIMETYPGESIERGAQ